MKRIFLICFLIAQCGYAGYLYHTQTSSYDIFYKATCTDNQLLPSNSVALVNYTNETYDPFSEFASSLYTPTKAGVYLFNAEVPTTSALAYQYNLTFRSDTTNVLARVVNASSIANVNFTYPITALKYANATGEAYGFYAQVSTTNISVEATNRPCSSGAAYFGDTNTLFYFQGDTSTATITNNLLSSIGYTATIDTQAGWRAGSNVYNIVSNGLWLFMNNIAFASIAAGVRVDNRINYIQAGTTNTAFQKLTYVGAECAFSDSLVAAVYATNNISVQFSCLQASGSTLTLTNTSAQALYFGDTSAAKFVLASTVNDQSIAASTDTILKYTNMLYDTESGLDIATGTYTVRRTGLWLFAANSQWENVASGKITRWRAEQVSGTTTNIISENRLVTANAGSYHAGQVSFLYNATNTTDKIQIKVFHNDSTARSVLGNVNSDFIGIWLGNKHFATTRGPILIDGRPVIINTP